MTVPLGGIRLAASTALITDTFTDWNGLYSPWTITGDDVIDGVFYGTNELIIEQAQLAYWESNPDAEQEPLQRSARMERTYTGLPANRLVLVSCPTQWKLGTGIGNFVGMEVNGRRFAPGAGPTGSLSAPTVAMVGYGTTNSSGELEVAFVVENVQPSFNLHLNIDNLTISTPAQELADIFYDAGRLYIGGSQVSITRNGVQFDPQETWEDMDFPGKASPVDGLDEIVSTRPVLRTTAMLTGEYQFTVYRPDGTWGPHASVSGGRTYTLPVLRSAIANTLTDVIAVWPRARGDFVAVHFPRAICRRFGMVGADKDEGAIAIEIEARVPASSALGAVPYKIHTFQTGTTTPA